MMWRWARQNLFDTPLNSVITVVCALFIYWLSSALFSWGISNADWLGDSAADCESSGACWVFVSVRFSQFVYGFYPEASRWRVDLVFMSAAALLLWLAVPRLPYKGWLGVVAVVVFPIVAALVLIGGWAGLQYVPTHLWGGLAVTLIIAYVGIIAALPLGVLLALGRASELPIVKTICTAYIELWRAVPLITVLFMASLMLPLFMPDGSQDIDKLLRAIVGVVLFQAAYLAEVVRGGLQALPKGQWEAAKSLGLGYWQSMGLVVLPQALKLMIPGIVNTFIALFKDTSLVLIIGIFDLLGSVQNAINDPEWPDVSIEAFVFAGFVFWVFCFAISKYSQYLERKLNTEH